MANWRLLNYVRPLIKQHKNAARIPLVISIPQAADFSLKNRPEVGVIQENIRFKKKNRKKGEMRNDNIVEKNFH